MELGFVETGGAANPKSSPKTCPTCKPATSLSNPAPARARGSVEIRKIITVINNNNNNKNNN